MNTKQISLAGCLIFDRQGKLLLIHRNTPKRTQWELPGGKVDAGEEPEDAAVRELKEELGVTVRLLKKAGERDFTEDGYTMHYVWFRAEVTSGTPLSGRTHSTRSVLFRQKNWKEWNLSFRQCEKSD
jgi:8-oxo-dGTP diphosphatase